jgi:hypothetical protein
MCRTVIPEVHCQGMRVRIQRQYVQATEASDKLSLPVVFTNALLVPVEVPKRDHSYVAVETKRAGGEKRVPGKALLWKWPPRRSRWMCTS